MIDAIRNAYIKNQIHTNRISSSFSTPQATPIQTHRLSLPSSILPFLTMPDLNYPVGQLKLTDIEVESELPPYLLREGSTTTGLSEDIRFLSRYSQVQPITRPTDFSNSFQDKYAYFYWQKKRQQKGNNNRKKKKSNLYYIEAI